MARPPHLVADGDELYLDAAVDGTRRELTLSARAEALLVDDLGYGNADIVPFVVVKALVLGGGATLPEGNDPREAAWGLSGADGGSDPTAEDCYRTAEYLRGIEIAESAVETMREHVASTGLSRYLTADEVSSTADRVGGLSDIARDL